MPLAPPAPVGGPGYQPFPDVARRNFLQQHLEIPALVRLLRLPSGGRILEVGCGRGVRLGPLARALTPSLLIGLDIDIGTCYHIARPSVALREVVRVLRPGGLFVSETVSSQLLCHRRWCDAGADPRLKEGVS